jgi:hypothetical protein
MTTHTLDLSTLRAALHDREQTTPCEGGEVVARIVVDGSALRIELSWRDDEGRAGRMPSAVYDALAEHSDTDELEAAIEEATGQAVSLAWAETSATVRLRPKGWIRITEDEIPEGTRFDVPRHCQGQIVEVAYGGPSSDRYEYGPGAPLKRVHDRSDRTTSYYRRG